jgi:hypothetical protein
MSQSASFPPSYSQSVGGVGPTDTGPESISFAPPDKLPDLIPSEGGRCPQLALSLPALMGGGTLSTISKEVSFQLTEQDLQAFLHKHPLPNGKCLATGLAVIAAAPLPISPLTRDT